MEIKFKKNGLERPFHPLQVLGWVIICLNSLVGYLIILPLISGTHQVVFAISFSLILLLVLVSGYKLTSSDPTDYSLDSTKRKHCNYCKRSVDSSSKHCRRCDRCVRRFDHHCKWVNNCVGTKNYTIFCVLIGAISLIYLLISAELLYLFVILLQDTSEFQKSFFFWLILFSGLQALVFLVLIFILIGIHLWINYKGITTYEMITNNNKAVHDESKVCNNLNDQSNPEGEQERIVLDTSQKNNSIDPDNST